MPTLALLSSYWAQIAPYLTCINGIKISIILVFTLILLNMAKKN